MTTNSTTEYLASLIHEPCKLPQEHPVSWLRTTQYAARRRMRYLPRWAMPDRNPAG